MFNPDLTKVNSSVNNALEEDIGLGDVTGELIDPLKFQAAELICREESVLCGSSWFDAAFKILDPNIEIIWNQKEGSFIKKDTVIANLNGNAKCMVASERTGLNFLQMMSGIAYKTYSYQQELLDSETVLLDTRKTIPGLRYEQKYSVLVGGGQNHRMGLYDAALIKENHIASAGSISAAVESLRRNNLKTIEVEVENLDQLKEAIESKANIAMLDNFNDVDLAEATKISNGKIKLEVSGNINRVELKKLKNLKIDYISSGDLTKNISATDYSLIFKTLD
ncbi:MAG: carboxylating nicotinate-nucleotide diphosphorylase [Gammaproteobacteria bacterium]|jgi:nicotinate-nucleotide pyrophosphorylase (carboxylating)|tara:strand:+ start:1751 stop:2590 length:840 start_codon:yes stop_codon:yes gene_type:complete